MSTHTPGPYQVDGVHLVDDIADEPLPHAVIRDKNERWVALVEITDTEGEANAAILAAAPELLEALYGMLSVEGEHSIGCKEYAPGFDDSKCCLVRIARRAIAKAEGRS